MLKPDEETPLTDEQKDQVVDVLIAILTRLLAKGKLRGATGSE